MIRLLPCLLIFLAAGCINSKSESGVTNAWRATDVPAFERGKTTQTDVAKALGPPSQLIELENQLVFYYLAERAESKGIILIVYNQTKERIVYDRAIFFFDRKGVLQDYALSLEEVAYQPPEAPERPESPEKE
jgi:hypothetical protein